MNQPMEQKNDLSSARVGDKLVYYPQGLSQSSVLLTVLAMQDGEYPLVMDLGDNKGVACFTFEGKYVIPRLHPTLFWSKPTIIYPPPPKRVVKKKIMGWVGFDKIESGIIYVRSFIFDTEVEANEFADLDPSIPRAVYVEHEYEEVSNE